MRLIKPKEEEWTEKQGYSKKKFLNETELNFSGLVFQKIRLKSGEIAETHHHKKATEIFYFLNDNGYFVVNGKKIVLKKEDILVIGPFDKHKVVNNSKKEFLYLCFKYNAQEGDFFWN